MIFQIFLNSEELLFEENSKFLVFIGGSCPPRITQLIELTKPQEQEQKSDGNADSPYGTEDDLPYEKA